MFLIDENKLFFGAPQDFYGICYVYPLQIKDIIALGEDKYGQMIGMLTLDKRTLEKELLSKGADQKDFNMSVFEYLLLSAHFNETFFLEFKKALSTFIREDIHIFIEDKKIVIGNITENRYIDENNFEDFQNILRAQNDLKVPDPIPKNESAMARKFRLRREQVEEAKRRQSKKNGENMPLCDALSCLMCFNVGIDIDNVKNLSLHAFHQLFKRAQKKYKYELDIRMIAAGADPKKIKPEDWLGKLDN